MEYFNPYKHLKEQFVSNLTGSSKGDIFFLLTNYSFWILIRHCIGCSWTSYESVKKDAKSSGSGKNLKAYSAALIVDFLCISVPYVLFMSVLAEWTFGITIMSFVLLIFIRMFCRNRSPLLQETDISSIRAAISSYRVSMMLGTCLSILAVDFKIFPRRYAKTETYGTSLMDLGVGSFVVANSFVSRKARGISNITFGYALRSTSPMIILGLTRVISTSSVNYQIHISEYGVHWNFFFTLAAVSILTSVINVHPTYCGVLGSFILIVYQISLLCGLNEYLLTEKREADIVSQNKEGIFSIFGYWGLYLVGVRIGRYLFFEDGVLKNKKQTTTRVWALCLFFWAVTLLLDSHVEKVSRRMCNLAYVSLILACNLQVLAIMLWDDVSRCKTSALEEALNRNMLPTFLLANVLTGLVNLSVDTLSVPSVSAVAILLAYAFVLSFAVGFADFLGIRLKFW